MSSKARERVIANWAKSRAAVIALVTNMAAPQAGRKASTSGRRTPLRGPATMQKTANRDAAVGAAKIFWAVPGGRFATVSNGSSGAADGAARGRGRLEAAWKKGRCAGFIWTVVSVSHHSTSSHAA